MCDAVVIEEHCETGVKWLVGFGSSNPTEDNAVELKTKDDADRLVRLLRERAMSVCPNRE
jgi:hypothetical protein